MTSLGREWIGVVKSTGIVRRMDELGRVVVPAELRRTLGLPEKAPIEIFTQGEEVILRRYEPLCVFCGQGGDMVQFHGKRVCRTCRQGLSEPSPAA